ncbi:MAG: hypothetical protein ABFD96_18020 [Armatimonadia bacterium]
MGDVIGSVLRDVVSPTLGAGLMVAGFSFVREWARQMKDERKRKLVLALVRAAEQLYGPGKGEAKRRYVREKAKQSGLGEVAREQVEAAVYELTLEAEK